MVQQRSRDQISFLQQQLRVLAQRPRKLTLELHISPADSPAETQSTLL